MSTATERIPVLVTTMEKRQIAKMAKDAGLSMGELLRRKASKPRTQKTLLGTLHALFKKELSEQQLSQLFASLCSHGIVKVEGDKVSYVLPSEH